MQPQGSITRLLVQLKDGDLAAAEPICERYLGQLQQFATRRMKDAPNAVEEAEDVVQDALGNFFAALSSGRFGKLDDREDLWQVLVMLTKRRAIDAYRRQRRQPTRTEADLPRPTDQDAADPIANSPDATDAFGYLAAFTLRELLELLPDESLRTVATTKLDGATNAELAAQLEVSERTIERKLKIIREIWSESK